MLKKDIKMVGACGFEPQTATRVKVVGKAFPIVSAVKSLKNQPARPEKQSTDG